MTVFTLGEQANRIVMAQGLLGEWNPPFSEKSMKTLPPEMLSETISKLELMIQDQNRGQICELKIEIENGMLILTGKSTSYYGKQIAQEAAKCRGEFQVGENRIVVCK